MLMYIGIPLIGQACHSLMVVKQRVNDDNYIVELDMVSPAKNPAFTLSPDVEVPNE